MNRVMFLFLLSFALSGCSDKREDERLEDFETSLRYKTYRLASEKTVKGVVEVYNEEAQEEVSVDDAHSILGLIWVVQGRSRLSYIEADILEGLGYPEDDDLLLALRSISLFGMDMPDLSKQYYERLKIKHAEASSKSLEEVELEHKLFLTAMIVVGFVHGNDEMSKFAAESLEAVSQLDYLSPLVGVIAESKEINVIETSKKLYELSKSDRFSEHSKAMIEDVADVIKENKNKELLTEEIVQTIVNRLGKRVIEDIFAEEKMNGLLDRMKEIPEKLSKEDTSDK